MLSYLLWMWYNDKDKMLISSTTGNTDFDHLVNMSVCLKEINLIQVLSLLKTLQWLPHMIKFSKVQAHNVQALTRPKLFFKSSRDPQSGTLSSLAEKSQHGWINRKHTNWKKIVISDTTLHSKCSISSVTQRSLPWS